MVTNVKQKDIKADSNKINTNLFRKGIGVTPFFFRYR